MKVLLSIKPKYVERILSGEKRFEFRRKIFRNSSVSEVYMYSTYPVKAIVATFTINKIHEMPVKALWEKTEKYAGIQEKDFFAYFSGKNYGFAIEIDEVKRLSDPIYPKKLLNNFVPPQSFMYLSQDFMSQTEEIQIQPSVQQHFPNFPSLQPQSLNALTWTEDIEIGKLSSRK